MDEKCIQRRASERYVYELHRDKIESEEDGLTLINSVEKLLFIDRKLGKLSIRGHFVKNGCIILYYIWEIEL